LKSRASALWTFVDDVLFPKQELGVAATPSRNLFCDEWAESFWIFRDSPFVPQPPDRVKMSRRKNPFFDEFFFIGGPAPEFLQFGPQGTRHLFPSHGNPDLLICESTFYTLACAVGCLQGFLCKAIHLDVDSFTQQTVLLSLCVIGM
jgi:hypothetical protein